MERGNTSGASIPFRQVHGINTNLEIHNSFYEDTDFLHAYLVSPGGKKEHVLALVRGVPTDNCIIQEINHSLVMTPRIIFQDVPAKKFHEVYNMFETTLDFIVRLHPYCIVVVGGGGRKDVSPSFKDIVRQMVRGFEFLHTKGVTIKTFDPKNVFLMTTEPPLVKIGGDFIRCGDSRKEEDFENLALYLEHCLNVFDIQGNEFNRVLQILRSPPTNKSNSSMASS